MKNLKKGKFIQRYADIYLKETKTDEENCRS